MKRALLACALAAWLSSGCDVATVQPVPNTTAQNECQSRSECGAGECVDNQCLSRHGTLGVALVEVTPPANATASAGLQFLLTNVALAPAGGDLRLALEAVSRLAVEVTIPGRNCVPTFTDNGVKLASAPDSSIPGSITITPSQRTLGVSTPPAIAQSTLINNSYFGFSANVPPGIYDIYVQPSPHGADCIVPPQVRRAQIFDAGPQGIEIRLPEPSQFELHVTWTPGDGALSGWFVDMLDPGSGHVISNSAQLALGTGGKTDYVATVSYLPVVGDTSASSAQELLRLSPPSGVTAPTILLARSALGLFDANRGTLSQFSSLPVPVHVRGQVTALATPRPVAATVTLVATTITGIEPGVLASFVRTFRVGDDGQFDLDLLPGTYRVLAVPTVALSAQDGSSDAPLSEVTTEWVVPSSPATQAGKVIELSQALLVSGEARDSNGTPVATALVEAVASTAVLQHDVLHEALGEITAVPRASTGTVMASGSFNLLADSGTFDVSVRPQAGTGFAWSVVPAVGVGTTPETSAGVNLASLLSPLPVQYGGTVTVPGATADSAVAVPGALIRAYAYTLKGSYTSDPAKADSVVQIAETRADDTGGFKLLIPASLNDGAQ
ncbi:MAG: hypothetical protein ABI548_11280 [Polyangiaceae bacterium]